VGSTLTITASCSNNPTSYTWTGCASTTSTCTDSVSVLGPKSYGLVATNANGNSPNATASVTWVAVPTTPPVCSVSSTAGSQTVGLSVTLTATCTGAPTSFVWSGCTSTTSTCTATASVTGSVTYYVSGVNQFGTGAAAGVIVAWTTAGGGGGGGGGGAGFCNQYSKVEQFSMAWGDSRTRYKTTDYGGFNDGTVVVASFTVPSSPASYATAGYSAWAEWGSPPTYRHLTLSKSPCDFRDPDGTGVNGPLAATAGTVPLINFNVGGPAGSGNDSTMSLVPGQTYYLNIRNLNCGGGSCDASTTMAWPQ